MECQTLVAGSRWNKPLLKADFGHAFSAPNKDILILMVCCNTNVSLDFLINLAICLNILLWKRPTQQPQLHLPEPADVPHQVQHHRVSTSAITARSLMTPFASTPCCKTSQVQKSEGMMEQPHPHAVSPLRHNSSRFQHTDSYIGLGDCFCSCSID